MKPLLISITIVLIAAPVAYAAKFTGQTSQERRAVVVTDADGVPSRVSITWHARCDDDSTLRLRTSFLQPMKESSDTFFRDGGPYTTEVPGEDGRTYKVLATARVRGTLATENKWRGRFRASAEVRRNGRHVTDCATRKIRWRATG